MKKLFKPLSLVLILAIIASSLAFGIIAFGADNEHITTFKATESRTDTDGNRIVKSDRIVYDVNTCNNGGSAQFALSDTSKTLTAGNYKLIVYASLLSNPTNPTDTVSTFTFYPDGTSVFITADMFSMLNKVQPIVLSFSIASITSNSTLAFFTSRNCSFEIQKYILIKSDEVCYDYAEIEDLTGRNGRLAVIPGEGVAGSAPSGDVFGDFSLSLTNIPAGTYNIICRMKRTGTDSNPNAAMLYYNYFPGAGSTTPAYGDITMDKLPEQDMYYNVVVPVTLSDPTTSFMLRVVTGIVDCVLDYVEFADPDIDTSVAAGKFILEFNATATTASPATNRIVKPESVQYDSRTCTSGPSFCTANYSGTLKAGNYKLILFAALLSETAAATDVLQFSYYNNGGAEVVKSLINAGQFSMLAKFQPIVIPFTLATDTVSDAFAIFKTDMASVEVQKFYIIGSDTIMYDYAEVESLPGKDGSLAVLPGEGTVGIAPPSGTVIGNFTVALASVPAGTYNVICRMKRTTDDALTSAAIYYNFYTKEGAETSASNKGWTSVTLSDMPTKDTYYSISVPLTIATNATEVTVNIQTGFGTCVLDYIEFADADINTAVINTGELAPIEQVVKAQETVSLIPNTVALPDGVSIKTTAADQAAATTKACVAGTSLTILPGTYKVTLRLQVNSAVANQVEFASFDMYGNVSGVGGETFCYNSIRGVQVPTLDTWTNVEFYFKTDKTVSGTQVRVWAWGYADFSVNTITVTPIADTDPVKWSVVNTPGSDSGRFTATGVACEPGDPLGSAVYNPHPDWGGQSLDEGQYTIKIHAKQTAAASTNSDPIFTFQTAYTAGSTSTTTQKKSFVQSDFGAVGTDSVFTITFDVYAGMRFKNIHFIFKYSGSSSVEFNFLEITKTGAAITAPELPFFTIEAEEMVRRIGLDSNSGVIVAPGMGYSTALYGGSVTIPAGSYKAVVYMRIHTKSGNGNTEAAAFELLTSPNGGPQVVMYKTPIRESQFAETGTYYAIEIPFSTAQNLINSQIRIDYPQNLIIEVDKIMILQSTFAVPAAEQDASTNGGRPAGVTAVNSYDVPLVRSNIQFVSNASGALVDDSIQFNINEHIPGAQSNITNKVFLTNGKKIARFYVRTLEQAEGLLNGSYEFFQVMLLQNGLPVQIKSYRATDMYMYNNRDMIIDIPFIADDQNAMSFAVKWNGSYSIAVDKVIFKDSSDADIKTHNIAMTKAGDNNSASITSGDLAGFDNIDYIRFTTDKGVNTILPVTYFLNWLHENHTVELSVNAVDTQKLAKMKALASLYNKPPEDLAEFDLGITLKSQIGDIAISTMHTVVDLEIAVPQNLRGGNDMRALGYCIQSSNALFTPVTQLAADHSVVTIQTGRLGHHYVALLADASQQIDYDQDKDKDKDADKNKDDGKDVPKTGRTAAAGAFSGLLAMASGLLVLTRKKRRVS